MLGGLQGVVQSISLSHRADTGDTGAAERRTRATACVLRLLSVATALHWIVSDPTPRESEFDTDTPVSPVLQFTLATAGGTFRFV